MTAVVLPDTPHSVTATERLHALDAVRAFALLSGIVLHAALSFLPGFSDVGWPISDRSPSLVLALLFYVIHQFRMTLFFLIAGFLGHMAFHRKGTRAFVIDRLKRIGIPLVVGWPLLMPFIVGAFIAAVVLTPGYVPRTESPEKVSLPFPLTHLWFLYVLLWLYALTIIVRGLFGSLIDRSDRVRRAIDHCVNLFFSGPWGTIVAAAPVCAALCWIDKWEMWFGIPTPDQSLIPNLPAFVAFSTAFGLGWLIHRQPDQLKVWERDWLSYLMGAVVFTVASLSIIGIKPAYLPTERDSLRFAYAVCYSLACWNWTFALLGMGLRFCSDPNPRLRYLADSSYWLYLIHLPVVFWAQTLVMRWPLTWMIKFPLILAVTLPLMLVSYHWLVRSTWIGGLLNGKRYPRRVTSVPVVTCEAA